MLFLVKVPGRKKHVKLSELMKRGEELFAHSGKEGPMLCSASCGAAERVPKDAYLASPCAVLPLPYGECFGSAEGYRHIAGEGLEPGPIPDGAYYRLRRELGDMRRFESAAFSVRQLFLRDDPEDAALACRMARAAHSAFDAGAFAASERFAESLCIAVHSRENGACVGCGFGASDPEIGEAWISALLVPAHEDEALMLLVNDLLRRMARLAPFATVCAPCADARLVRLLRRSGFSGGDIWLGEQKPGGSIE